MSANDDILDYLQLIKTEHIGPKTFVQLINQYGSAAEAIKNLPSRFKPADRSVAEEELKLAKHLNVHILISSSPAYPQSLLNIPDYPPILYAKGHIELLNSPLSLAVVGSRNASINGRKLASKISHDLTRQGVIIVSGMARGIDSSAHRGALYANDQSGPTIAVLGTGVDVPYPSENKDLYEQICRQGCVISEFPLGTTPQANNFPRRNRLISGLCRGVLVAEANLHSGSLITAYTATEQGREVLAVPGSPLDGRAQGTNKLIKEGAYLVENADDILDILQHNFSYCQPKEHQKLSPSPDLLTPPLDFETKTDNIPAQKNSTNTVLAYITHDGVDVDDIIQDSGIDSATVSAELLYLELEGKIIRQPGNKVALVK